MTKSTFNSFLILFFAGVFSLLISPLQGTSQQTIDQNKFTRICVGFYNVENLFDTIKDPVKIDEEFTPQGSYQWNTARYLTKLERLAEVISMMGQDVTPDGPAVLGLAEVENKEVLVDLAMQPLIKGRNYQIVHYESPDARGIDVAFLYQPEYFKYLSSKAYHTEIGGANGSPTRDQLLVTGELLGERMHFIVTHWPSRRGGEHESRPLRIDAARVARYMMDSILVAEPSAKIVIMGDFNDDPANISVRVHLRGVAQKERLRHDRLYNPFASIHQSGRGTLSYRSNWNLFDQILVTPSLVGNDGSALRFSTAEVFDRPFLREQSGPYEGSPFRSYGGRNYLGGYSDHFPVYIFLKRELQ